MYVYMDIKRWIIKKHEFIFMKLLCSEIKPFFNIHKTQDDFFT